MGSDNLSGLAVVASVALFFRHLTNRIQANSFSNRQVSLLRQKIFCNSQFRISRALEKMQLSGWKIR